MIGGDLKTSSMVVTPTSLNKSPLTIQIPTGCTGVDIFRMVNASGTGIGGINYNLLAYGNIAGDICNGRLTLSSTDPCPTGDINGGGFVYFLPYNGIGMITIANPVGQFETLCLPSTGISMNITGFSGICDWFVYNNNGVPALTQVAWSTLVAGTSVRQTGYALSNIGDYWYPNTSPVTWCGLGSTTPIANRYVGTVYTTSGLAYDTMIFRGVWNMHNQQMRPFYQSAAYYTYSTAGQANVWRYSNNSQTYQQVELINGHPNNQLAQICISSLMFNDKGGETYGYLYRGLGINAVTWPANTQYIQQNGQSVATICSGPQFISIPPGYNFIAAIEALNATPSTPGGTVTGSYYSNWLYGWMMG